MSRGQTRNAQQYDLVLACRKRGLSNVEIAAETGIPYLQVGRIAAKLIEEGLIQRIPRGRKRGSDLAHHPEDPRFQKIVEMKRQDATLREISISLGGTTQNIAYHLKCIVRVHGAQTVAPATPRYTTAQAAAFAGVCSGTFRYWCYAAGIVTNRHSRRTFTQEMIDQACRGADQRRHHTCAVCGTNFTRIIGRRAQRAYCSSRCRQRRNVQASPFDPKTSRSWYHKLWERLQSHDIPAHERWMTHSQAMEHSRLSSMQVTYLRNRSIVHTKPSPNRAWRGKPVRLFAASEVKFAGTLFAAWRSMR